MIMIGQVVLHGLPKEHGESSGALTDAIDEGSHVIGDVDEKILRESFAEVRPSLSRVRQRLLAMSFAHRVGSEGRGGEQRMVT